MYYNATSMLYNIILGKYRQTSFLVSHRGDDEGSEDCFGLLSSELPKGQVRRGDVAKIIPIRLVLDHATSVVMGVIESVQRQHQITSYTTTAPEHENHPRDPAI